MQPLLSPPDPRPRGWAGVHQPERLATVAVAITFAAVGALVPLSLAYPLIAVGAAVAVALALVVSACPAGATYVMLALTPLVVGADRAGGSIPLRPNEVLLGVVFAGLALRGLWATLHGGSVRWKLLQVDRAILVLTVAGALLPLVWLYARTGDVGSGDLQYAGVLVKYLALYALVRITIHSSRQVAIALAAVLAAATVVALVAIVQTLIPIDMPGWFRTYYAPAGQERLLEIGRGSSTLASSIAVGDHLSFALAVALAWLVKGLPGRALVGTVTGVLAVGIVAAGQFSAFIALIVAVGAAGWATGYLRTFVAGAVPLAALGAAVAWPVVERRLVGFATPTGRPTSWTDRLSNLQTYFWPPLTDGGFWLGVRPEARVVAPERWRDWIWIESGHTWLLWTGGLPLLAAYLWFAWTGLSTTRRRARLDGAIGVAATAGFAATLVVFVLMTFDPHLTMRGSADLAFPLLALALVGAGRPADGPEHRVPTLPPQHEEVP